MSLSMSSFSIGVLFLVMAKLFLNYVSPAKRGPYPPGPKPMPIIGNALDILNVKDHGPAYAEWGRKCKSDIVFASAFGSNILILNKKEDAIELLERRAGKYSSRPFIPGASISGWEGVISLVEYGGYWRRLRTLSHRLFNSQASKKYWPVMEERVHQFLVDLVENPGQLYPNNKTLSASFIMQIMYGYKVKSPKDRLVLLMDQCFEQACCLFSPEGSIVNLLPFLAHIPPSFAGPMTSLKKAAETKTLFRYLSEVMWKYSDDSVISGTAIPSLVTDFIENHRTSPASEIEKKIVSDMAVAIYVGGSETTIGFTAAFFYLMVKHPEVQKKAQAELDRIIGNGRLPTFEDRPHLPYIEAIYRECLRWSQTLPTGVAHSLTEDDYYKGYFIPKGTAVIANIYGMTHDEDVYPDPFTFKPERFIDENGNLTNDDRILAYGFGRRICSGKAVASALAWCIIASVLSCLDINKDKDEFGNEIEVNDDFHTGGIIYHKDEFKCSIVPRGPSHRKLIFERTMSE